MTAEARKINRPRTPQPHELFFCEVCENKFPFKGGKLICPACGAQGQENLVPIYMENDPEEEQLHSDIDWQAGD